MKKGNSKKIVYTFFIFVISLVFGILSTNNKYLDGYMAANNINGLNNVYENCGYEQKENTFVYNGTEGSYIQLYGFREDTKQIMLAFDEKNDKDVPVLLRYVNDDGSVLEKSASATWKKGKYTVILDIEPAKYNSYLIYIEHTFVLNDVYYAIPNSVKDDKTIFYLFAFVFSCILSALVYISDTVEKIINWLNAKIKDGIIYLINNKKVVLHKSLGIIIIIAITNICFHLICPSIGGSRWLTKSITIATLIGFLLGIYIMFRKQAAKKIEWFALSSVLCVGTIFVIALPPTVGLSWDDQIHCQNACDLAHVYDKVDPFADFLLESRCREKKITEHEQEAFCSILQDTIDAHYYKGNNNVWQLTRVAYIPSAIGIFFAKSIGLSFGKMILIGRWMNVLFLAIITFFSVRALESGKIIPLMIALIPTNIFIASNYTYDTWLTGCSMLGLSMFFGEWQRKDQEIRKSSFWGIPIAMFLAVLPKMVYAPLICITFFMPRKKFKTKKHACYYYMLILFAIFAPVIIIYMQNFMGNAVPNEDLRGGAEVSSVSQLEFIKSEPLKAGRIMFNYLMEYLNPLKEGNQYLVNFAYISFLPQFTYFIIGVLIIGALVSREEGETKFPWWVKCGSLVVYATIGFMAALSMYIAFTAVGAETVAGCQGRYILPAIFPTLFILSRWRGKTYVKNLLKEENINIAICIMMIYVGLYGLFIGCGFEIKLPWS